MIRESYFIKLHVIIIYILIIRYTYHEMPSYHTRADSRSRIPLLFLLHICKGICHLCLYWNSFSKSPHCPSTPFANIIRLRQWKWEWEWKGNETKRPFASAEYTSQASQGWIVEGLKTTINLSRLKLIIIINDKLQFRICFSFLYTVFLIFIFPQTAIDFPFFFSENILCHAATVENTLIMRCGNK